MSICFKLFCVMLFIGRFGMANEVDRITLFGIGYLCLMCSTARCGVIGFRLLNQLHYYSAKVGCIGQFIRYGHLVHLLYPSVQLCRFCINFLYCSRECGRHTYYFSKSIQLWAIDNHNFLKLSALRGTFLTRSVLIFR